MTVAKVRIAGLAPTQKLGIQKLCSKLNSLQQFYGFDYVGSSETCPPPDMQFNQYSLKLLGETFCSLYPQSREYAYDIVLTKKKIEGGFFTKTEGRLGVVTNADTELIRKESGKNLEKYFAYNIMEVVMWLQYDAEHEDGEEDVGCLFDSCYSPRANHVLGLKECRICESCVDFLKSMKHVPDEQMDAIENILKWVKRPPLIVQVKWSVSLGLLALGSVLYLHQIYLQVAAIALAASGWIARVIDQPWPLLERR